MSTAKAQRVLLERLSGSATVLLAVHLALPTVPSWADGEDADGRAVLLVGAHALRGSPEGGATITAVLSALAEGWVPEAVLSSSVAPRMAAAVHEIVAGQADEVLVDGERGTGKTVGTSLTLPVLAELHRRAGFDGPLRVLWVHDSLASAAAKTGRSLTEPLWSGCWQLRDSQRAAAFVLAGTDLVLCDFVGSQDQTAAERLKAACHVVIVEEAVPSLAESGGVDMRSYDVARSSQRLPTRRRVAVVVTNPGAPDHWCFQRFIVPGRPGAIRCRVPASDRLTEEDVTRLRGAFQGSPDLEQRLALGEWAELVLGPAVTPGFRDEHVAPERRHPVRHVPLWCGHDGGHTPTTIIGASYQGSVLIHAALASERAGTRQHVETLVRPWLAAHAPWALENPSTLLLHRFDPSMETGEQADIDQDPVRVLRELLGGRLRAGAQSWPGRLEPVLALLGRFNTFTGRPALQIDAVDAALLIRALRGRWHYPTVHGVVSRDGAVKDHPWSDLGDSFAYLVGGIAPSRERDQDGALPHRRSFMARTDINPMGSRRRSGPSRPTGGGLHTPWPS